MNEKSASGKPKSEPLPCNAIVYRVLLKKRWINEDTQRVDAGAYFLREKEKDRGLSVNIAASCSPQQSRRSHKSVVVRIAMYKLLHFLSMVSFPRNNRLQGK
jgi:hypothetical protein